MIDDTRLLLIFGLATFAGLTLLFAELRWFRRVGLADRLAPYTPGAASARAGLLSAESFREVLAPAAHMIGNRLAVLFGVHDDTATRLRRVHARVDAAAFRARQATHAMVGLAAAVAVSVGLGLPTPLAMSTVLGLPLLVFLIIEQQLARRSAAWQERVFHELPVVAEQLAMLTASGWSLSAALQRIGERGSGNCAADLRRLSRRVAQGLSDAEALAEWRETVDIPALDRLVAVLSLQRETTDLERLIADEARTMRSEAQRRLIETIERRNQQVWIPVTVAALVPGALLMGVPFIDALTLFSAA